MEDGAKAGALDRQTKLALAAMALAIFVIANDFTALAVALPDIEKDLRSDVTASQWVLNAYTLVFGVLIVTGGRLADIHGRRKIFFIGISIFAAFSALGAASPDVQSLIGARTLMGVGGALVWPAVIGMTFAILPADRASLAGAMILGISGLGNAFGPILGGFLTDTVDWRWIFILNIPIAVIAVLAVRKSVPDDPPSTDDRRLDRIGVAFLTAGLVALLLALDQSNQWGWGDWRIIGLVVFCVVMLGALVRSQRSDDPDNLLPRDVLSNERFTWACIATFLATGTFFSVLLYVPQYMQKVLDYSALGSGVGFLPLMLVFAAVAFAAGPLYSKLGPRILLLGGAIALVAGGLLLTLPDAGSGYGTLVPGLLVLGLGVGLFYPTITTAGVTAIAPERSSLAGGILYMAQLTGGAIGLGLATTIFTSVSTNHAAAGFHEAFVDGVDAAIRTEALIGVTAIFAVLFVTAKAAKGAKETAAAAKAGGGVGGDSAAAKRPEAGADD